jgi:hypothetical protein
MKFQGIPFVFLLTFNNYLSGYYVGTIGNQEDIWI